MPLTQEYTDTTEVKKAQPQTSNSKVEILKNLLENQTLSPRERFEEIQQWLTKI